MLGLDAFARLREGRQHWCRECFRAYFRERGSLHLRQSGDARRKRVAAAKAVVAGYLSEHPCVDCGEADLLVLDFDHLRDKAECVGALAGRGAPAARILAEIAKCEVRCANCHRRVTAWRAGWSRVTGVGARALPRPVRRNLSHVHRVLSEGSCVDCGESDMTVLEFDHVGIKRGKVSVMLWDVGLATLEREISQCEIRCCNCHRRVTAARRVAGVPGTTVPASRRSSAGRATDF
jgi:Zn finger protein HypA/HybF involved in hydrogenase expression